MVIGGTPSQQLIAFLALGLVILVHELGHAAAAMLFTTTAVEVRVGLGRELLQRRVGRLDLSVGPVPFGGFCRYHGDMLTRQQTAAVAAAGPAATVVTLLAALVLRHAATAPLAQLAADCIVPCVSGLVLTLAPIRYPGLNGAPGMASDGRTIVDCLYEHRPAGPASRAIGDRLRRHWTSRTRRQPERHPPAARPVNPGLQRHRLRELERSLTSVPPPNLKPTRSPAPRASRSGVSSHRRFPGAHDGRWYARPVDRQDVLLAILGVAMVLALKL